MYAVGRAKKEAIRNAERVADLPSLPRPPRDAETGTELRTMTSWYGSSNPYTPSHSMQRTDHTSTATTPTIASDAYDLGIARHPTPYSAMTDIPSTPNIAMASPERRGMDTGRKADDGYCASRTK